MMSQERDGSAWQFQEKRTEREEELKIRQKNSNLKAKVKREKENRRYKCHGAKREDPKVGATTVAENIMSEIARRIQKQAKPVRRVERPKENRIGIHNKGNGQIGTQGSGQYNGRICDQAMPKDGEKESQKV